jgi:hypothetical protein
MVATIQQIIGKINPKLYAKNGKDLLRKYGSIDKIPAEEVEIQPISQHHLGYDSSSETLEPIYFFILDLMTDVGLDVEKFIDNFTSTPGSGHFSELMGKGTIMQQQGGKILGDINTVLRSVLNLVYDLKEFKIRLQTYDNFKSDDKTKSESARLSLKQIWMDRVDINKGNSSVKAMAFQGGFQTLIDAFLFVKDEKDVDKVDLNERVKRVLKPRIQEFNIWLEQSEKELRKRYELERTYLKSQVNSLKLYSRWARPYLKAAQELEMKEMGRAPALVKTFSTTILELGLLGKSKIDVNKKVESGDFPLDFKKMKMKRDYFSCVVVDFKFRSIPQKINQQTYVFGGKAEITFSTYALNKDELDRFNKEFDDSDIGNVLKLIEGGTTESLGQLQEEINFFLEDKEKESEEKKRGEKGDNPFLALMGYYNKPAEKSKKEEKPADGQKTILPDDWIEKNHLRVLAEEEAKNTAFDLFDIYKNAHGMVSFT